MHDDPPAAGQAHSNASVIARGRPFDGRSEHEANSKKDEANAEEESQCRSDDDDTRTSQAQSTQRG
jgi:hypothetical protein